jgi:hypothetical protein
MELETAFKILLFRNEMWPLNEKLSRKVRAVESGYLRRHLWVTSKNNKERNIVGRRQCYLINYGNRALR